MKKFRIFVFLILALAASLFCLASCGGGDGEKGENITVTFVNAGGVYKTVRGDADSIADIDMSSDPLTSPIGYGFDGWYSEDGVRYFDWFGRKVPDLVIDRDLTLHAKFVPHNYTFILNPGEGSFSDSATEKTVSAVYDGVLLAFPVPETDNPALVFDGWFTENGDRYTNGGIPVADKLTASSFGGLKTGNLSGETYTSRLRAVFKPRTLTVTLDYNDGSLETETLTLGYGEKLPDLSAYTKDTGKEAVSGWSASPYNTVEIPTAVTEDIRIYAVWCPYKTVNFMLPSGEAQAVKIFEETNRITLPNLEIPGYNLLGWYLTNSLSGNKVESVHYSNMADTYWGNWEMAEYTLSFSAKDAAIADMQYYYGDTAVLPTPSVPGYAFRGWYHDDPETCFYTIPETLWGNLTLTAKLIPNTYMVALDAVGGRLGDAFFTVEYGTNYTIPVPEKEGFAFLGWFDAPQDGNRVTNRQGAGISVWQTADNDCTLYAYWDVRTYVVEFETNGGTTVDSATYTYGAPFRLPSPPKKMGVIFGGWFTEDGATEYTARSTVTADLKLYAKWIESTPIYDASDLLAVANNPNGNYHLMTDINLDGAQWSPIYEFSGILDGQGHKIYNFTIAANNTASDLGFVIINKGIIRNLNMEGVTFNLVRDAHNATGGILAAHNRGRIVNCRITGGAAKYSMSMAGKGANLLAQIGIVAGVNEGVIEDCYTNTPISGSTTTIYDVSYYRETVARVGGIAGYSSGTIYGCHSASSVSASGNVVKYDYYSCDEGYAYAAIGGIVGTLGGGTVEACTSDANLSAVYGTIVNKWDEQLFIPNIGGIVGCQQNGTVTRSYANATVYGACYGYGYIGGFVGKQEGGEITNSYSVSAVDCNSNNNHFGAFAGYIAGKMHNCYADPRSYNTSYATYGFAETVATTGVISGCFSTLGTFSGEGGTKTNCHTATTDAEGNNPFKTDYIYDSLFWSKSVWTLDGEGYPTLTGVSIPEN